MKKFLSLILALLLCVGLVACGDGAQEPPASEEPSESPVQESLKPSEVPSPSMQADEMPLEIVESGYYAKSGSDKYYIQYAVTLKNNSESIAVKFPSFRITARDSDGAILGTDDVVLHDIAPGQTLVRASQGPSVDIEPASVEFEVIKPEDYNLVSPDLLDYPNLIPLEIENTRLGSDNITGEVFNSNDFDISSALITVVFRDENGALIAGDFTFVDSVTAGSKVPFEITLSRSDKEFVTSNFEVYAYPSW